MAVMLSETQCCLRIKEAAWLRRRDVISADRS